MKFKVNNDQMLSLIALIQQFIVQSKAAGLDVEDMLYVSILEEFHLKLLQEALLEKKKYQVKLSPTQAIAFFMCFNDMFPQISPAGNMMQTMCNKIRKQIILRCYTIHLKNPACFV